MRTLNLPHSFNITFNEFDRHTYTKRYLAVKLGVNYNFNSGKGFRAQGIEKNNDGSRLQKE